MCMGGMPMLPLRGVGRAGEAWVEELACAIAGKRACLSVLG